MTSALDAAAALTGPASPAFSAWSWGGLGLLLGIAAAVLVIRRHWR